MELVGVIFALALGMVLGLGLSAAGLRGVLALMPSKGKSSAA